MNNPPCLLPFTLILAFAPAAFGQEAPAATPEPSGAPAPAPAQVATESPAQPPKSRAERQADALSSFNFGEVDAALESVRSLLRECLALSISECDAATRASLYRDAGIMLADGKSDHGSAVRVFRLGLQADRSVTVPAGYRGPKVDTAFDEARRAEGLLPSTPPPVATTAPVAAPAAVTTTAAAQSAPAAPRRKSVLLHVATSLKIGPIWGNRGDEAAGQLGLEALAAHVGKTNAFAGGLLHADYNWFMADGAANWGGWGAAAMFGAASQRTAPAKLHYLTVGPGFVNWPDVGRVGFALHARYGASFRGFSFGLNWDLLHVPMPVDSITQVLFGAQLGFARLL